MSESHEPDAPTATSPTSDEAALADRVAPPFASPTTAARFDADLPATPAKDRSTPWWPFVAYLGVWAGAAGAVGWVFGTQPREGALSGSDAYAYMVLGGVGLTLLGPVVTIGVWLATYVRALPGDRAGLFSKAAVRGAAATFLGVTLWWVALLVADRLRVGRFW